MADEIQKEEVKERTPAIYEHLLVLGGGLFTFLPRHLKLGVVLLKLLQLSLDLHSVLGLSQGKLQTNKKIH